MRMCCAPYLAVGLFLCGSIGPPQVVHALYVCIAIYYRFVLSGAAFIAFVLIQVIMMSARSKCEIGLTVYSTHINMQT
jgi:hypothetical protein